MLMTKALLLAAGLGKRLQPLTHIWPKCLMPIHSHPLLEHWLCQLQQTRVTDVLINVHHHRSHLERFLDRQHFNSWVNHSFEPTLLGTAGTLRRHATRFAGHQIILIHADNWCLADINTFLEHHDRARPPGTVMTMMTFRTDEPKSCGILQLDSNNIVTNFVEKSSLAVGNLANAAIYVLEPSVLDEIMTNRSLTDFSSEVIPLFLGRIATWENTGIHRDIGSIEQLLLAQNDPRPKLDGYVNDEWQTYFENHPIHEAINQVSLGLS